MSTVRSLAWTMLLLILIFYAFGVGFTQVITDYCRDAAIDATGDFNALPSCTSAAMTFYWGSLPASMLTPFMAVTAGINWESCLTPLRDASIPSAIAFLFYIVFTVLALLNVVTGIFCHSAIEAAAADKDIAAMSQLENQKKYAATIRSMFAEIDEDDEDGITLDELEEALRDEEFCAYLESIEISTSDAWTLFRLMDSDKSGNLDLEELVSGCMSLRGQASAMQVAKVSMEQGTMRRSLKNMDKRLGAFLEDFKQNHRARSKP
eukprot:TRINITY_DN21289_c0_g1_i2.p1 TRINITY_DN21289_c0_g1~~TRINITY_DN21289_c0_g1_i2.p1  ORF type:complete len:264 (+),score=46.76 TRINITY_DN21289_c0_g1_i2:3-794(+)